jgi:UDP-3-O-[3-hydroxymyristoyl] glucosamine N-acyltransferase
VGENCIIVAQVGIAGSTVIGQGVVLAGQAGISGHLRIGDGARIGAQAGVINDVPAGAEYSDYPARPHAEAMRAQASLRRLPKLMQRIRALEKALLGKEGAES